MKSRMRRGVIVIRVGGQARYLRCCYCRGDVIIGVRGGTRGVIRRAGGPWSERANPKRLRAPRSERRAEERRENTGQFLSARRGGPYVLLLLGRDSMSRANS